MDQLRVGLYVDLELSWFEHPFAFSHFKIKSEDQIKIIRSLGLKTVRYNPALSDSVPAQKNAAPETAPKPVPEMASKAAPEMSQEPEVVETNPDILEAIAAKRVMMERNKAQREAAARIENAFVNTAKAIRDIEKDLFVRPAETVRQATELITQIAESILCAPELAIHVMGDKTGGEELYFHSLNVTTLSMMMAREIRLPQEVVGVLGMGALFHDIGCKDIPKRILMKTEPLTQAERHLFEMHCQYGVEAGQRLKFAPAVLAIIGEHHELFDGSGYPEKLKGESVGLLSRIVVIANHYDELCNPLNVAEALTPNEALSLMFAKLRSKFDPKLLQVFIRCLGVYPPGTIVQLSNGVIGMVATVNTTKPMKPVLVIYDANIPKAEAILVDLERETDLIIAKAIRPAQVPREVYNYLSPRKRVSYYFDAGQPGQEGGAV
ncbi:HD family phosphohydrolase [Sulfurimicrobium lacus]|uniref:HD family phosphohydrolase n=2 Tax=Sulfurimicrobium lacus TaxID=2715678 RepID=A0A6F8VAP8_9PROT|nr:HD family phosphohydrolase [Sulfurimicrobium lacus]